MAQRPHHQHVVRAGGRARERPDQIGLGAEEAALAAQRSIVLQQPVELGAASGRGLDCETRAFAGAKHVAPFTVKIPAQRFLRTAEIDPRRGVARHHAAHARTAHHGIAVTTCGKLRHPDRELAPAEAPRRVDRGDDGLVVAGRASVVEPQRAARDPDQLAEPGNASRECLDHGRRLASAVDHGAGDPDPCRRRDGLAIGPRLLEARSAGAADQPVPARPVAGVPGDVESVVLGD